MRRTWSRKTGIETVTFSGNNPVRPPTGIPPMATSITARRCAHGIFCFCKSMFALTRVRNALHIVAATLLFSLPLAASAASTGIVISQIYGAGGNSGAVYQNDYVELFNLSGAPVSVAGWSVQYASATGTGTFASNGAVALS